MSNAKDRYWVLIETGSNQRFVFGMNKRRASVGASHLISKVGGTWVNDATMKHKAGCKTKDCIESVVGASGKALLLVSLADCGREIVGDVTMRALCAAPGLGVWGAVATKANAQANENGHGAECECSGCQLEAIHEQHNEIRLSAGSPLSRYPTLPLFRPCEFTGLPAVTLGKEAPGSSLRAMAAPFSASFSAGSMDGQRNPAMDRLHADVCGALLWGVERGSQLEPVTPRQ